MNPPVHGPEPVVRVRRGTGAALREARQRRGLTVAEAARHLLLSSAQVGDLESDGCSCFYNDGFRLRAVEAYARWIGVPDPIEHGGPDGVRSRDAAADAPRGRRWPAAVAAAAVLFAAGLLWGHRGATHAPVAPPTPPTRRAVPSPTAFRPVPTVPTVPTAPPRQPERSDLLIELDASSWLFARYADGTTVNRRIERAQPFDLGNDLVYLVVGGERALLSRGGRARRLDQWASDGKIRLNRDLLAGVLAELGP